MLRINRHPILYLTAPTHRAFLFYFPADGCNISPICFPPSSLSRRLVLLVLPLKAFSPMPSRCIKNHEVIVKKKKNHEIVEIPRTPAKLVEVGPRHAKCKSRAAQCNCSESIWTARKYELILKYLKTTNYATGRAFDTIAGGASSTLSPFVAGAAAAAGVGAGAGAAVPSADLSMFGTVRPSNSENSASR